MNAHPTIVLGGWGFSEQVMDPIVPDRASQGVAVLSPNPPHAVLEKVSAALRSQPHQLIGWSLGAMLALQCAAAYPRFVSRLLLISPTARFTACDGYSCGQPPSLLRAMKRQLVRDPHAVLTEFYRQCFSPIPAPGDIDRLLPRLNPDICRDELVQGLDYLLETDLRRQLPRIQASVVIAHGGRDTIIPPAAADHLAVSLRKRLLAQITLPNAGHALPLTHAPLLQRLVRLFLY